ncbi:MAG TPA: hypothetical protein VFZ21_15295 [Gemmatimonadaceae bacterium]|nr:hypothetical protein [Gemmatimonadaceae bacterium]
MPALSAVLREHIRVTGLVLRGPALIAAALIGLVTLVAWLQSVSMGVVLYFYEWPTLLPGLMGALLPVAVWARDERSGHGYLWTLPVDRRRHAFTKVFAGWVWLMVGVALFALWRPVLTLASGGRVLPPETLYLLTTHVPLAGPLDQTTLQAVRWTPSPLIWAVPFTAATGSYLLGSALVLASRRPLRWVIGTVLAYAIVSVVSDAAGAQFRVSWLMDAPGGLLERLVQGRYGLDALLTARTGTLSTIVPLATGQRAMVWRAVPDLSDWHIATFVWTGAGLLALWLAAFRHREQRRA